MNDWQNWVGREEVRTDLVDAGLVARFLATLDRAGADGDAAPQGLHWCLALPSAPTAALGPDGHPRRDEDGPGLLPPVPLPRRMWASSDVRFLRPLRIGEAVARRSAVAAITAKTGASGELVFVDVRHETHGRDGAAIEETQTIVYRAAAPAGTPTVPPPPGPARFDPSGCDAHRRVLPGAPLLFRYSALTFNSHRIHYDVPYARDEEGYRGLVVHGPLTATLLLDLAREAYGEQPFDRFTFRALSPAIVDEPLHLTLRMDGAACHLAVHADDGRPVMVASGGRAAIAVAGE